MLSSITPLGERGRRRRWGVTVTSYLLGSAAGGAAVGALLGALGAGVGALLGGVLGARGPSPLRPSGAAAAAILAVVFALSAAADLHPAGRRLLPTLHRQVNEDWLHTYRGWVVGVGYGVQLGMGVVTIVTTATVYAAFALALLTASPVAGMVIGATFGTVRAVPVLALRRVTTPTGLSRTHRRMQRWAPAVHRGVAAAQALASLALLAVVA